MSSRSKDAGAKISMSEEIPIGPNRCISCGGEYGEHLPECPDASNTKRCRIKRKHDSEPFEVKIMARVDGYLMVRRKGCIPFVCRESDLCD